VEGALVALWVLFPGVVKALAEASSLCLEDMGAIDSSKGKRESQN